MSVPNDIPRIQYQGNGSGTSFAYPAIIYFATELTVIGTVTATNVSTPYVLGTDYTIDTTELGQTSGVNVVFGTAPPSGTLVTIARIVPLLETLQLSEGTNFPSLTGQRQLDEIVMMIQQLQDQLTRVPMLPVTEPLGIVPLLRSQDLLVYDVSTGSTMQVSITPGNYKDQTAGVDWIPTLGGIALTTIPYPIMPINSSDRQIWTHNTIDPTTGYITASVMEHGTSMPSDTSTQSYDLVSNILPNPGTLASVNVQGGGVSGSRSYFYCGLLPATDGSGHLYNS